MDLRKMILQRLSDGPVFVKKPRDFITELGIDDPTRQTVQTDVLMMLDGLEKLNLITKSREPDELNCDLRLPTRGPMAWEYRLTEKGQMELDRRSMARISV